MHPSDRAGRGVGDALAAEHHRHRTVRRRARVEITQRIPEEKRLLDHLQIDVGQVQMRLRVAQRGLTVLHCDEMPDVARRAGSIHVGADQRCKVAAGARNKRRRERHRDRQPPRRVRLRLLLVRDRQDTLVHTGRDELRGNDRRRTAHRTRRVHAHHRLAHRAERVGEVQLGHRDAFEHVRRLAEHDGVDVGPRHARVVERLRRGLAHEPRHRDVLARRTVMRLADTDDGRELLTHLVGLQDADEVLLQARAGRGVGEGAVRGAAGDAGRGLADADEPRRHRRRRLGAQAGPKRLVRPFGPG